MRVAALFAFLVACGAAEPAALTHEGVAAEIEAARACTAASECVSLGNRCGFTCPVINDAERDAIEALLQDWYDAGNEDDCDAICLGGEVRCEEGRCADDGHL